jgi:hypothetical protein
MSRTRLAHTPFLDAWRASLAAATDGRGLKTELARHLAASRGQGLQIWKVGIGKILNGHTIPNGEDVLEISHWLASRTAKPTPATTPPKHRRHRPTPARPGQT